MSIYSYQYRSLTQILETRFNTTIPIFNSIIVTDGTSLEKVIYTLSFKDGINCILTFELNHNNDLNIRYKIDTDNLDISGDYMDFIRNSLDNITRESIRGHLHKNKM